MAAGLFPPFPSIMLRKMNAGRKLLGECALIGSGRCNKMSQSGWCINSTHVFFTVLGHGSLRSGPWRIWWQVRGCFLVHRWLSFPWVLMFWKYPIMGRAALIRTSQILKWTDSM